MFYAHRRANGRRSALRHLLKTFDNRRRRRGLLINISEADLYARDLQRLADLIKKAQREGR
jgi:hypothetical protein